MSARQKNQTVVPPASQTVPPQIVLTPEARGKAAAHDRWMAQGGTPGRRGTFRRGPMKGLTVDQARQKFEGMWASAPDALKEGYARHGMSGATASEVSAAGGVSPTPKIVPTSNATLNQAFPGETTAEVYARHQKSRGVGTPSVAPTPHNKDRPDKIQRQPDTVSVGTPEEQARVQAMVAEGADFATADNSGSGKAMTAWQRQVEFQNAERDKGKSAPAAPAKQEMTAWEKMQASKRSAPPAPAVTPSPGAGAVGSAVAAPAQAATSQTAQAEIVGPPRPQVTPTLPTVAASPLGAPTGSPLLPRTAPNTDPAIKSDGAGLTRVNRLTGLPFGHSPGDALPMSADATMRQRAADSQARQVTGITPTPAKSPSMMMRGPASQGERVGTTIAPTPPPRVNDPDIIRKDNAAYANYQSSFTGGNPGDADFAAAKNGQQAIYDGASSLDQAKLVANSLKRFPATVNAPRATVVQGVQPARPAMVRR